MSSVLITGINGFIGKVLCRRFILDGWQVRGTTRDIKKLELLPPEAEIFEINAIDARTDWSKVLAGIDTVVHLAARVHVMHETAADPLAEFRKVNTAGASTLARQAAAAGVKRFIFLSTIGVNGDASYGKPFNENDSPAPHSPYSISKWEAEEQLERISAESNMRIIQIRPPLVYGPGNPGNFLALLRIVSKGIPLPFASIGNLKSFIYVGNLADVLLLCARHPAAEGRYLVSEGQDVSTPDLIRKIASALKVRARLFHMPLGLLKIAGILTGKGKTIRQLSDSLQIDSSKIRTELGWRPPYTMESGLTETAEWFRQAAAGTTGGRH